MKTQDNQRLEAEAFGEETVGALLAGGAWPEAFAVCAGEASVRVIESRVERQIQRCGCASRPGPVEYLRVALTIEARAGERRRAMPVEELYPARIEAALGQPLDARAPGRVARAVFGALGKSSHTERLFACPIVPMRLFEPIVNALAAPPRPGSRADWLARHLIEVLGADGGGAIASARVGARLVELHAHDLALHDGLRAKGEVEMSAEIILRGDGDAVGRWRGRARLAEPCEALYALGAPDEHERARLAEAARAWRSEIERKLAEVVRAGATRIAPREVVPQLSVVDAREIARHAA